MLQAISPEKKWIGCTIALAIILSIVYGLYAHHTIPRGSTFLGYLFGALGFGMMLLVTAYSLRKRWITHGLLLWRSIAARKKRFREKVDAAYHSIMVLERRIEREHLNASDVEKEMKSILRASGLARYFDFEIERLADQADMWTSKAAKIILKRRETVGRLQNWLAFHQYFGALSLLVIFFHTGFRLGGTVAALSMVSMALVVFSGFVAMYLYGVLPQKGIRGKEQFVPEEIAEALEDIVGELNQLILGETEAIRNTLEREIKVGLKRRLKRRNVDQETWNISMPEGLSKPEQRDFQRGVALLFQKEYMEALLASTRHIRRVCTAWLNVHIALTIFMWVFVVVHIVSVLYY